MTFDELIGAIPETFLDGSVQRLHAGEKPKDIGDRVCSAVTRWGETQGHR
jgi:hypothetical protein